ncbi:uncharacterized protein LOC108669681 [Hyalella azteca]|uniref:Uncharacterized protein LOC108669681 n=1 Tax=Hyalella azteca TaxID=294128 RepID=A0A8B7NG19_HYAAZ|nr:uncharacterized protein LOC108669681 [Hyalella azteca]XP_018012571.1 uncharacterized protein LOC108669681 [Hyalella azteca]XP_047740981.1 uncharacterized protein LOC108669681 [Hyalella azteca]
MTSTTVHYENECQPTSVNTISLPVVHSSRTARPIYSTNWSQYQYLEKELAKLGYDEENPPPADLLELLKTKHKDYEPNEERKVCSSPARERKDIKTCESMHEAILSPRKEIKPSPYSITYKRSQKIVVPRYVDVNSLPKNTVLGVPFNTASLLFRQCQHQTLMTQDDEELQQPTKYSEMKKTAVGGIEDSKNTEEAESEKAIGMKSAGLDSHNLDSIEYNTEYFQQHYEQPLDKYDAINNFIAAARHDASDTRSIVSNASSNCTESADLQYSREQEEMYPNALFRPSPTKSKSESLIVEPPTSPSSVARESFFSGNQLQFATLQALQKYLIARSSSLVGFNSGYGYAFDTSSCSSIIANSNSESADLESACEQEEMYPSLGRNYSPVTAHNDSLRVEPPTSPSRAPSESSENLPQSSSVCYTGCGSTPYFLSASAAANFWDDPSGSDELPKVKANSAHFSNLNNLSDSPPTKTSSITIGSASKYFPPVAKTQEQFAPYCSISCTTTEKRLNSETCLPSRNGIAHDDASCDSRMCDPSSGNIARTIASNIHSITHNTTEFIPSSNSNEALPSSYDFATGYMPAYQEASNSVVSGPETQYKLMHGQTNKCHASDNDFCISHVRYPTITTTDHGSSTHPTTSPYAPVASSYATPALNSSTTASRLPRNSSNSFHSSITQPNLNYQFDVDYYPYLLTPRAENGLNELPGSRQEIFSAAHKSGEPKRAPESVVVDIGYSDYVSPSSKPSTVGGFLSKLWK